MTTMPLSVTPDFPDTVISFAMSFWAQDADIPVDIVWQDEHANFASELSQHRSVNCSCLSKPLQELMVHHGDAQSDGSGAAPVSDNIVADSPSMPVTSAAAAMAAPDGQAGSTNQPQSTGRCPLQPLGGAQ